MRTGGSGGGDAWMTAIPIVILLVFAIMVAGGPKEFLKTTEKSMQSALKWTVERIR
jgi:hypothetical protein